jgi:hypothetical protein
MLQVESFLERAEAELCSLPPSPPMLYSASELCPLVVTDVGFENESGAGLYDRFSARAWASSTGMTWILQIMSKLHELGGEPPPSHEQTTMDSLTISIVA